MERGLRAPLFLCVVSFTGSMPLGIVYFAAVFWYVTRSE
jgi:hypothetical protein